MKASFLALIALAPLVGGCAGQSSANLSLSAAPGRPTWIGEYRSYDGQVAGCPTTSVPGGEVVAPPNHGRVNFVVEREHRAVQRPICRGQRRKAAVVYYTPQRGYRGPDAFAYRIRFSDGDTRDVGVRLSVR